MASLLQLILLYRVNIQISMRSLVPKSSVSDGLTIIAYCVSEIVRQRISPSLGQFELTIRIYFSESEDDLVTRMYTDIEAFRILV